MEQCIQAAKKAQSVLGMVNRQFKIIDKEAFWIIYKTYARPHLKYWGGHQSYRRIKCYWKKYKEERVEWLKNSRNCHTRPGWRSWVPVSVRWKDWRLHGDLIETVKILTGKGHVSCSKFFELANVTSELKRTLVEIIQTKLSYNYQTKLTSVCGSSVSGTSYHRKSSTHCCSIHSRTSWIDTGTIWAFFSWLAT